MAIEGMTLLNDRPDLINKMLNLDRVIYPACFQQRPHPCRRPRAEVSIRVDVTDGAELKALDDTFACKHVHHSARGLDDVEHAPNIHAGLFDIADILETFGQS